jgi:hypothetical protein
MSEKTELQRDILLAWYNNPDATNAEIANMCDCSASYVSQVTNRFDDYNQMEAMMDQQDRELEKMFGEGIFENSRNSNQVGTFPSPGQQTSNLSNTQGEGIADVYEDLPDNAAGYLIRAFILLVLAYVLFETITILIL